MNLSYYDNHPLKFQVMQLKEQTENEKECLQLIALTKKFKFRKRVIDYIINNFNKYNFNEWLILLSYESLTIIKKLDKYWDIDERKLRLQILSYDKDLAFKTEKCELQSLNECIKNYYKERLVYYHVKYNIPIKEFKFESNNVKNILYDNKKEILYNDYKIKVAEYYPDFYKAGMILRSCLTGYSNWQKTLRLQHLRFFIYDQRDNIIGTILYDLRKKEVYGYKVKYQNFNEQTIFNISKEINKICAFNLLEFEYTTHGQKREYANQSL